MLLCATHRTALQTLAISVPSSAQRMQMCDTMVSIMSGCLCTMTRTTPVLSSVKQRARALWWSWRQRCWMGRAVTPSPWTCASVESARWEEDSESCIVFCQSRTSYLFLLIYLLLKSQLLLVDSRYCGDKI